MKYTGNFPFHGYTETITHKEYTNILDAVRLNKLIVVRTICGLHVPTITRVMLSSETIGNSNEENIRMITYSSYEENYTGLSLFDIGVTGVQNEDGTHTVRFQLHLQAHVDTDESDFDNLSVLATKSVDTTVLRDISNEGYNYKDFFCGGHITDVKKTEEKQAEVIINNFGYGGIPLRSYIVSQSEEYFDSNTTGDAAANIHNQLITGINLIPYFDKLGENQTVTVEEVTATDNIQSFVKELINQGVKSLFVTTKTGINTATIKAEFREKDNVNAFYDEYELSIYKESSQKTPKSSA